MKSPTLRAFLNVWFVVGMGFLVLGTGPLIIGGLLTDAGLANIGNGLWFGLLFTFTFLPSLLLILIGFYVAIVRLIKADAGAA